MLKIVAALVAVAVSVSAADQFEFLRHGAEEARAQRDIPAACALYRQALNLNLNWSDGWWAFGNLEFVSSNYTDAAQAFQHFTELDPELAEGWAMRGMAALRENLYTDAVAYFDRSLRLQFNTIPALREMVLTNHASVLIRTGHFEDGLNELRAFDTGEPQPEYLKALGLAALHRRMMPNEVPASDSTVLQAAGRVELLALHEDASAAEAAEALTNDFPTAQGVHYAAGMVFFPGNLERAEVEFRRELAIDPESRAAQSMSAYAALMLHHASPQDLRQAREAADSDPQNAGYQYVLGRLCADQGDYPCSVAALERAVQLKSDILEYHVALVSAYSKAKLYAKADAERRRALDTKFPHR